MKNKLEVALRAVSLKLFSPPPRLVVTTTLPPSYHVTGVVDGMEWGGMDRRTEVDTVAVAEFPLHLCRHPVIVGPKGATLKRISAENAVRITLPSEKDAAAQQQQRGWSSSSPPPPPPSSSSSSSLLDKNLIVQVRC